MRRILCTWLPGFPISRLRRLTASPLENSPFALIETHRGVRLLACIDGAAEAAGLHVGQRLADARAICPSLEATDADPTADAAALARLADWCLRYTPMAAPDPPDGLVLDITGCAHLFGGEASLAAHLSARLANAGLPSRIAICGSAAAAWALARWHAAPSAPLILSSGQEMAALALLPVACLRLDERAIGSLRRVGLKTVGEMARIARGELAARFGPLPLTRLEQATGAAPEAIDWPHPAPPWEERLGFLEPIGTPEDLARALGLLATRLCVRLEAHQLGAHGFTAQFFRLDGATPSLAIAAARPVRDAAYIAKLLQEKLDTLDPGFGIEAMVLHATTPEPATPPQQSLDGAANSPTALPELIDALSNRIGQDRLWRLAPHQSHVPERAVLRAPPLTQKSRKPTPWQPEAAPPRPLRLLRRPERIEVTAPLPDEPPLLFRWRRTVHRVRAATGPERISAEWWRASPSQDPDRPETDRLRDYYLVEDISGARFWNLRTSLRLPAWYLHGLFG